MIDANEKTIIEKAIEVPLDPEAAFDLFTDGINRWWPKDSHSLAESAETTVRVEPRVGGQVVETQPDGSEAPWGRITVWEPGQRLGIRWHVGRDEDEATDLDIRFLPTDTGTRVELTHGGFDALRDGAVMTANYNRGWDHVLGHCYGGACQRRAA